jgi:hypothetical protein
MSKTVNYTEEQASELSDAYVACETDEARAQCVEDFSQKLNKSVKSIRQKLVTLKVYQKAEKKTKTGGKIERKENIVADIARALGVAATGLSGLEKATKNALEIIRAGLQPDSE